MRLICFVQGGCKFETIREEWIRPKEEGDHLSLLRFSECSYCKDIRATLTHPVDFNSRWSIATKLYHRVEGKMA